MPTVFDELTQELSPGASLESCPGVLYKEQPIKQTANRDEQYLKSCSLPQNFRTKLDSFIGIMHHKDTTLRVNKIDYKIACEVFAMMPQYVSPIDAGKLTKSASTNNSDIIIKAVQKYAPLFEEEIISELLEKYQELWDIYINSKPDIQFVFNYLQTFAQEIQPAYQKLQNAMVLVITDNDQPQAEQNKISVNIKTESIHRLANLKLCNIDCPALSDRLPDLVRSLTNPALADILYVLEYTEEGTTPAFSYQNISVMDVMKIINNFVSNKPNILKSFDELEDFCEMLKSKKSDPGYNIPAYKLESASYRYNQIALYLLRFKTIKNNFDSQNSVLDALKELAELLGSI